MSGKSQTYIIPILTGRCVENSREAQSVLDKVSLLKKHNIKVKRINDASTDIFRRLNLDLRSHHERNIVASGDESSLEMFVRSYCRFTPHESDIVFVDTFKREYATFCDVQRLPRSVVNAGVMDEKFGISEDRITVHVLERTDRQASSTGAPDVVGDMLSTLVIRRGTLSGIFFRDSVLVFANLFSMLLCISWLVTLVFYVEFKLILLDPDPIGSPTDLEVVHTHDSRAAGY